VNEIVLSYVTGTYNRIHSLQNMVNSVRSSIGAHWPGVSGLGYEIVIVDGGSTDGTIEWCKMQPDIVLVEQGELLGAIKAFNAGFAAARGMYVVAGNDDIVILDETLIQAIAFMQDHPDVGIGCFWQDREPIGPWHVEIMPAVLNGRQISVPYGQVCIVPRWLGNEVGWWGNTGARTYGGDNELSCQVLERGYKVGPTCEYNRETGDLPWAAIHDNKIEDNLRAINTRGQRDGDLWGQRWTRIIDGQSRTGPIISTEPYKPNPIPRYTRFLYLPIYEPGHDIQKTQKRGLREALARAGLVVEVDYAGLAQRNGPRWMIEYVMDVADCWQPDVWIFQVHSVGEWSAEVIRALKAEYPRAKMVNWNGDYHPEDLLSSPNVELAKAFDLQLVVTTKVADAYRRAGVDWKYWQIGFEQSDAAPDAHTPHHDIVFLGNGYSPARQRFGSFLKSLPFNVGIYGSWGNGIADGFTLYNFDEGQKIYRAAKVSIGDDQWGAPGFVSNRLFQAMAASGAVYMQKRVPGLEELLGLVDGVHYVAWDSLPDLRKKIEWAMSNEVERARIAAAGRQLMLDRHSFDARVKELLSWL
jgi:glycosyltransferase involved in cell wall biosynthesis